MESPLYRGSIYILHRRGRFTPKRGNVINDKVDGLNRVRCMTAGKIVSALAFEPTSTLAGRKDLRVAPKIEQQANQ
jgi:hypothetical protein